jgi:hypothetical protein
MSSLNQPVKAYIQVEGDTPIKCLFNPAEISLSKDADWKTEANPDNNVSKVDFSGGKSAKLSVKLFFDTTETGSDVREHTDRLLKLTLISQNAPNNKKRPPLCKFIWGAQQSFQAYVPSVSINFTFFSPSGVPLRAEASVTFMQYQDEQIFPPQNPTSRSEARKTRVVVAGETLDLIAYQEYGNPAHWRHIAETNCLSDPKDLRPGQILELVPLP